MKKEQVIILLLPVIISAILLVNFFVIPKDIQDLLKLNIENVQVYQLITSAYTHLTWEHLLGNLIAFLTSYFLVYYIIIRKLKAEKQYIKFILSCLILLPVFTSVIRLFFLKPFGLMVLGGYCGFSVVLFALFGSLHSLVPIYKKTKKKQWGYILHITLPFVFLFIWHIVVQPLMLGNMIGIDSHIIGYVIGAFLAYYFFKK